MKNQLYIACGLLMAMTLGIGTGTAQSGIELHILRENEEGERETFERKYDSAEEMREDEEFREFLGADDRFEFQSDDEGDKRVRIHSFKNGKSYSFSFGGGADDVMPFVFDGDGRFDFELDGDIEELLEELNSMDWADGRKEREERRYREFHDDESIVVEDLTEDELKKRMKKKGPLELQALRIFPGRHDFQIRFRLPEEGELTVRIEDEKGQELQKRFYHRFDGTYSERFDMSGYQSGTYFIDIILNGKVLSKRLIKR